MTDLTPGYFEYDIVAGEDFKLTITVKENGILKDISGWSNFRSELRLTPDDLTVRATMAVDHTTDGTDSMIDVELDKVTTRSLQTNGIEGGTTDIFYDDEQLKTKRLGTGRWNLQRSSTTT